MPPMLWYGLRNQYHYSIGVFSTLGKTTAYSILPISDGGLKAFFIYKYTRHSTDETDDGISYLVRYEGYSFINAIKALAAFEG